MIDRIGILGFLVALIVSSNALAGSFLGQPDDGDVKLGNAKTHLYYLVPQDREVNSAYVDAIDWAAANIQRFYAQELGGATFIRATPTVKILHLNETAEAYRTEPDGSSEFTTFYYRVANEALERTGGRFDDPNNVYVFYVDAEPDCDQLEGAGGNGVTVLPSNDLRGLIGETWLDYCTGESRPEYTFTPDRFVGGLGHELGHAFGLPHPPGCDDGAASCDENALMWLGVYDYPNTYFRLDESAHLKGSTFVADDALPLAQANEQAWFIFSGVPENGSLTATAFLGRGGVFGPDFDPDQIMTPRFGVVSLELVDCTEIRFTFVSDEPAASFGNGTRHLQSLVHTTEQQECRATNSAAELEPELLAGTFLDPAFNGEGLFMMRGANGTVVGAYFTYGPAR